MLLRVCFIRARRDEEGFSTVESTSAGAKCKGGGVTA